MNLAYSETGSPNSPHLVLIHAFPLNRSMWKYQLKGLANQAHVVTPDMHGFGDSPIFSGKPNMTFYAKTIVTFLKQQRIDKAIFGGCSMGGYILFELWRSYPELFKGLILCDTRAEADTLEAREVRMKSMQSIQEEGLSPLAETMVPKLLCPKTLESKPKIVSETKDAILSNNADGVAQAQHAMAKRPNSTETLYTIDVPALILVGEQDGLTPPDLSRSMADKIPRSQMHVLSDAGHLSPLEQPEEANRIIGDFLNSC